ncbi:hypothetical protein IMZ48_45555 [Candidatus Bathyarchaeota archaeon]|nr:hypothetical protein [Candidatus Bathyarchaeota archaeon]
MPDKDKDYNLKNLKAGGSRRVGIFTYRILPVKDEDEKKKDDKKEDKKEDKNDRHDMQCRPLKENKYLFYDVMVYAVKAFCEDIGEQDDRDKDSEGMLAATCLAVI